MTWIELVKKYFPDVSGDEADTILWEFTAFPFADKETIEQQLAHVKEVGFEAVRKEFDDEMKEVSHD